MVEAISDTRTPHYWDVKRNRLVAGSIDEDDTRDRKVFVEPIGNRKFRKMVDRFIRVLDSKDAKQAQEAARSSPDKFNRLLSRRPDLKKAWLKSAGRELAMAAIDWLALQGIEEFVATGELSRFVSSDDLVEVTGDSEEE